jgi:hypothetical protein
LEFLRTDELPEIVYNAAFPEPYTIENIAQTMLSVFGMKGGPPTVPYRPALLASYVMELAALFGIPSPVHHRRIEKLYHSTHLSARKLCDMGFQFHFDLKSAIVDWKSSSPTGELC